MPLGNTALMVVSIDAARDFVMGQARLLDRRRFTFLTEGRGADDTRSALLAYRNDDAGFGSALEPDMRGWSSQPIGAQIALEVLLEIGRHDDDVIGSLLSWCDHHSIDGGLPFVLPTVQEAAAAPWWVATAEPSLNPTAAVVGNARALGAEHPWLDAAEAFCWLALARDAPGLEGHDALCAAALLEHAAAPPAGLIDRMADRVVGSLVALDPASTGYVLSPLQFASTPSSLARTWFDDDVIEAHLLSWEHQQQADGGWPITWEPPTAGAVNEWRGKRTVDVLRTLRAYGRI